MRFAGPFAVPLFAAVALAAPEGWHRSMEDGVAAARKSGRAVLVITGWTDPQ